MSIRDISIVLLPFGSAVGGLSLVAWGTLVEALAVAGGVIGLFVLVFWAFHKYETRGQQKRKKYRGVYS
jgi:hypothetical protein